MADGVADLIGRHREVDAIRLAIDNLAAKSADAGFDVPGEVRAHHSDRLARSEA
jgi:hypothetical protein